MHDSLVVHKVVVTWSPFVSTADDKTVLSNGRFMSSMIAEIYQHSTTSTIDRNQVMIAKVY